jgi:hypothetical protein
LVCFVFVLIGKKRKNVIYIFRKVILLKYLKLLKGKIIF